MLRNFVKQTILMATSVVVGLGLLPASAQPAFYQRAPTPQVEGEIRLPASASPSVEEEWFNMDGHLQVRNVSQATLVPFLPPRHLATGEAVIVAPGGAFLGLAIETEGYDVARALSDAGIAAFVLKYRLVETPGDFDVFVREIKAGRSGHPSSIRPPAGTPPTSMADAQSALIFVRDNAQQWNINPERIGMMGFSAGAILTLSVALDESTTSPPAFIAPIYPRMTAQSPLSTPPPMYVAISLDDFFMTDSGLGLIQSWLKTDAQVEFHLLGNGGHGFGLGSPGNARRVG